MLISMLLQLHRPTVTCRTIGKNERKRQVLRSERKKNQEAHEMAVVPSKQASKQAKKQKQTPLERVELSASRLQDFENHNSLTR